MPQNVLVTGGTGQVGQSLRGLAWPDEVELLTPSRQAVDLSSRASIDDYFASHAISAVINCAAYTAVDRAESHVSEAYATNAFGPAWLARASRSAGIPIIHVSTDYVFGGSSGSPRQPGEATAPSSAYGASKLAGEIAVLAATDRSAIVRTAWVFSPFGSNFLKTMLRLARDRNEIGVVGDQRGSPTSAEDLARALQRMVLRMIDDEAAPVGVFHYVNDGEATWAEFADEIMSQARLSGLPHASIRAVSSDEYSTAVERPKDSRLSTESLRDAYRTDHPHWRAATRHVVQAVASQLEQENDQ